MLRKTYGNDQTRPRRGSKAPGPGRKTWARLLAAAALVAVALSACSAQPKSVGGDGDRVPAYAYVTGEGKLMLLTEAKEGTQALEIADQVDVWWDYSVQFSKDGQGVYFLNTSGEGEEAEQTDLYYATLAQLRQGEAPQLIVEAVEDFWVLDNQNVVYGRYGEAWNMVVGLYDGQSDRIIAENSYGFELSEDEKSFYYTDLVDDGMNLYRIDLATGQEELLLEGVGDILTDLDAETLVYTVDESASEEDWNPYALYAAKAGQEPEKLAQAVYQVISAEAEGDEIRLEYLSAQIEEVTLYDLVNDAGDAQGEGVDQLRQALREWSYTKGSFSIYRYADGEAQLLAADVTRPSGQDGVYVYRKSVEGKVADLADLDPADDSFYAVITDALESETWYQSVGGVESELDLDGQEKGVEGMVTLHDREVILQINDGERYSLLTCAIRDNKLEPGRELASASASFWQTAGVDGQEDSRSLYFFADVAEGESESSGNLIRYRGGEREVLFQGVSRALLVQDSETCYGFAPVDESVDRLDMWKDGQAVTVTEELSRTADLPYALYGETMLYIETDGSLYAWDGQSSQLLAEDVRAVWANSQESYNWLSL